MEQFLGLQTWGTDLILWVQQISSSPLDAFFRVITLLGNPEAYLIILTLIYWCVNKRWGIRLLVLAMLSSWVNEAIKSLLRLPRPDPIRVRQLVTETSFGFPSNHAQTGGVIIWGYLAAMVRRSWFTVISVIMALMGVLLAVGRFAGGAQRRPAVFQGGDKKLVVIYDDFFLSHF